MKKIIFCLFFIFSIIGFSEKTCNDTDFRQTMINYANAQVGKPYSMTGPRVGPTSFDCSGLMSASIKAGGLTSISGRNEDFGTTASGLVSGSKTLIPRNDFSNLKPGDMVHFSPYSSGTTGHVGIVVANLGNGKVEIVDARGKKYGVQRRVKNLSSDSHYLGATSATQILKNNDCTNIIDKNGQIVAPPSGTSAGSPGSTGDDSQKIVKSDYLIDLNAVLKLYVSSFDKGAEAVGTDLIIALTFVFALTFIWEVIKNRVTNPEVIIGDFFFELFKFVFFLVVIKNFPAINRTAMNLCFKVAEAFGSTLTSYYVLNEIVGYYAQNVGVLIGEFSRQAFGFAVITNLPVFVIIFCLIIYTTLIFTYIIFQVVRAVMTYIIGTNFSLVLLPFYFSRYSGEYIPNPFSIFFKCVAQLFFTVLIIAISLGVLSDLSQFLENAIKSSGIQLWVFKIPTGALTPALDIMSLCTYAVAFTMVALIMKKTLRTITTSI